MKQKRTTMHIPRKGTFALMATLFLAACHYDEELTLCPLTIAVTYQQTATAPPQGTARVGVDLRDGHAQIFTDSTDAATGEVVFIVPPGIYQASTTASYVDSTGTTWWRYNFNGTKANIVVSPDSTNITEMNVKVSRKRIVR